MATNQTRTQQAVAAAPANDARRMASNAQKPASKPVGYGLPCSKCHLYYPADLDSCPTCQHKDRVSPVAPRIPAKAVQNASEPIANAAALEAEREEFLRQFKAQLREAHANASSATESACKFGENHPGAPGAAEICPSCYERIQERLDICEAALQIDLKEAAQIVYDAVWSDPSDPGKTYQNAAGALLTELRKRAGISVVRGPFQPLEH